MLVVAKFILTNMHPNQEEYVRMWEASEALKKKREENKEIKEHTERKIEEKLVLDAGKVCQEKRKYKEASSVSTFILPKIQLILTLYEPVK